MPVHLWSVFCTKASVDSATNNLSLFEVIEELTFVESPALQSEPVVVPLTSDLVTFSVRSNHDIPEKARARTLVLGPSGKKLGEGNFEIDLTNHMRSRNITHFNAMVIEGIGLHHFLVEFHDENTNEWHEVARIPLEIKIAESVGKH